MKNKFGNHLMAIASGILLLSGCIQMSPPGDYGLKPQPPPRPQPPPPQDPGPARQSERVNRTGTLMLYAEYVYNLSPSDYAHELDHVRQLVAKDKSQYRQLQYALALSAPGGDLRRALQALDAANGSSNRDPELSGLATLIGANLAERRRLEARLGAGTKRADELEKKVEAVKDIEKTMIEREKGAEKP